MFKKRPGVQKKTVPVLLSISSLSIDNRKVKRKSIVDNGSIDFCFNLERIDTSIVGYYYRYRYLYTIDIFIIERCFFSLLFLCSHPYFHLGIIEVLEYSYLQNLIVLEVYDCIVIVLNCSPSISNNKFGIHGIRIMIGSIILSRVLLLNIFYSLNPGQVKMQYQQ